MLIAKLAHPDLVNANLKSHSKNEVLAEIVECLFNNKKLQDKDTALQALIDREKKGSTGIGNSVAVPHARIENIKESVLFVGISQEGIEFDALDSKPVKIVILLLTPVSELAASLKVLANISRMVNDKCFREKLLNSSTNEQLYNILKQSSHDQKNLCLT